MTEQSFPFSGTTPGDAGPYSALRFANLLRAVLGQGTRPDALIDFYSGDGVNPALEVTQTSPASTQVRVREGIAFGRGYWYENDSDLFLDISVNTSGNPRIDTVALEINFDAQTSRMIIVEGAPAAMPVAPTMQQDDPFGVGGIYQIRRADIAVANGFSSITDADIDNSVGEDARRPLPAVNNSFVEIASGQLSSASLTLADITNIPPDYQDLILVVRARSTGGVNPLGIRFNGDTGASYSVNYEAVAGTTESHIHNVNLNQLEITHTSVVGTGDAGHFGHLEMEILSYARTGISRNGPFNGSGFQNATTLNRSQGVFGWENVADPIDQITIFSFLGITFDVGSSYVLYGRGAAS